MKKLYILFPKQVSNINIYKHVTWNNVLNSAEDIDNAENQIIYD